MWKKPDKIIVILLVIIAIFNFLAFIINPALVDPENPNVDIELVFAIMLTFGIIFEVLIIIILIIMIRKE
ncbi:MAG: hypothetical protein ACFFCE_08520 [Promethearchaeota archaeon]